MSGASTLAISWRLFDFLFLPSLVWGNVFSALILGGRVRQRLSTKWKAPKALALPFATLGFTIIVTLLLRLYIDRGLPWTLECDSPPYPLLSACGVQGNSNLLICAAAIMVIVICGVVLPADFNLVVAYDRLVAFTRTSLARSRARRRERSEAANQALVPLNGGGSYPPPALYTPTAADAMQLKLQRSQRTSMFGKVIFVLDARMELTRDEHELLVKYRLGNDVVYESSSRKRRKENTLAHLEMTKGGPSLRDSAGAQLWGVAKTMFWLGRAGVSATSAALSLRITINSLISGVHVECKSMGELLGTENAIREAAQNVRSYLDVAVTFDGREKIVEL